MITAFDSLPRRRSHYTAWEPPRCAGCGADPIDPLALVSIEYRYVYLVGQFCADCRYRIEQGQRAFLVEQLGVRR